MKKVLVFIDWFYPGYKAGGPITSNLNIIKALKDCFEFFVVTRNTDYAENLPYPNIIPNQWNEIEKNVTVFYLSKNNLKKQTIKKIIKKTEHDIIYINGIYSYFFSILPVWITKKIYNKKIIIAPRGMLSNSAIGIKLLKKLLFLKLSNWILLYKNVVFHATNHKEENDIKKNIKIRKNIVVATNLPAINKNRIGNKAKSNITKFITVARIAPEKNILFALQVIKQLNKTNLEFNIYGPIYNKQYWKQCVGIAKLINTSKSIKYHGVIENTNLFNKLSNSDFLFFPSRGENYGHVIIESLSAGCPVIISDQTPWRNLEEKGIGWDIPLDNPNKFKKVIELCCNMGQKEYTQMSTAAYEYAQNIINNPNILEQYYKLFEI